MSSCGDGSDFTLATFGGQLPHATSSCTISRARDRVRRHRRVDVRNRRAVERGEHRDARRAPSSSPSVGSPSRMSGPFTSPRTTPPGVQRDRAGARPRVALQPAGDPRADDGLDRGADRRHELRARDLRQVGGRARLTRSSTRPVRSTSAGASAGVDPPHRAPLGDRDRHRSRPLALDVRGADPRERVDPGDGRCPVEPDHGSPWWIRDAASIVGAGHPSRSPSRRCGRRRGTARRSRPSRRPARPRRRRRSARSAVGDGPSARRAAIHRSRRRGSTGARGRGPLGAGAGGCVGRRCSRPVLETDECAARARA